MEQIFAYCETPRCALEKNHSGEHKQLRCECGATAFLAQRQVGVIPAYTLAQWTSIDKNDPEHFIFDDIEQQLDTNGGIWHEWNEGALPICPTCFIDMSADGMFRPHDIATCRYYECAEQRGFDRGYELGKSEA